MISEQRQWLAYDIVVVNFEQIRFFQYNVLTLNDQCSHHIETSQLICRADQLTGFYMMGTLVVKGLII